MDSLFEKHEVQSCALSFVAGGYDARIRGAGVAESIQDDLLFMGRHYKTDIIFIVGDKERLYGIMGSADIDAVLEYYGNGQVMITYEGKHELATRLEAPDKLHDILTE